MSRRHTDGWYGENTNKDPFDIDTGKFDGTFNDFNGDEYRKALYESGEDRFANELANAEILEASGGGDANIQIGTKQ